MSPALFSLPPSPATSVSGTSLVFASVGRGHIGSYLCIARLVPPRIPSPPSLLPSNGVPPSISKRVNLRVQFPPMMGVPRCLTPPHIPSSPPRLPSPPPGLPSQLESAPVGGNVTLRCRSEVRHHHFHQHPHSGGDLTPNLTSPRQAFPASINYWIREGGETVSSGGRFRMSTVVVDHITRCWWWWWWL